MKMHEHKEDANVQAQHEQALAQARELEQRVNAALNPPVAWWRRFQVDVPQGRSGAWSVEHFNSEVSIAFFRALMTGREIHPGTYTRLVYDDPRNAGNEDHREVVMSDVPAEIADHLPFLEAAYGDVLVCGLGLGMVTRALLTFNDNVRSVTVIEKNEDVIKLVSPTLCAFGHRYRCIQGSAYTWEPPHQVRFDCAFFDIWNTINPKNVIMMRRLRNRYKRWMRSTASPVMAWLEEVCAYMREVDPIDERKAKRYKYKKVQAEAEAWGASRRRLVEAWKQVEINDPWKTP